MGIAVWEPSHRAGQYDIIIKLFGPYRLCLPSSFTPIFQQSDYQMTDDPSHTLLFVPSDVPDRMRQSEHQPAISQVGMSCNSDGGSNSIASQVGDNGLSPVSITRTNDTQTTVKERHSAQSIKRKKRKAEKKRMLRQEKKEGEVAAVTAEVFHQLGLPYNTLISILYKSHKAEHEKSMLGKLLYADDAIFKNNYTIDRPGIVYVWDKNAKKVVFAVRCSTADELSEQEHDSFRSLFMHLHNNFKLHAAIANNGVLVDGKMWGLGWRPGFDKGYDYGEYAKSVGVSEDQWKALCNKDEAMHTFYGQRYASLAPAFWHAQKHFNVENKAPFFGYDYLEDLEKDEWAFASNLTFTKSDNKERMLIAFQNQVA